MTALFAAPPVAGAEAATAAAPVGGIEEVVVRAVRRSASLGDLDRSAAVRSVEDPGAVETITELLRHAPGTFFQQTTPGQSTPILRGLRGSQVLHLVDGMRLNHALFRDAPNQYLALVPVEGLEAVEVLPGAAPALYGADALGGVVVLRSRMPEVGQDGLHGSARATAGWSSADLRRTLGLSGEVRGDRAAAAFGYADRSFGNRRTASGGRVSATGYEAHSAWLNGVLTLGDRQRLELVGQWVEQPSTPRVDELTAGFGQTGPASERFLFDPNSRSMVRVGWRWRSAGRSARSVRLDLSRQRIVDDRLTRDVGATSTNLENNRTTLDGVVLQFNDELAGVGRLVAGAELYSDRVDSARAERTDAGALVPRAPRFGDGARMRTAAVYLVPEWTPRQDFSVSVGLRASAFRVEVPGSAGAGDVDLDAREITGRVGIRWHPTERWTVYGSYGRGFRPPNVFDLGALGPRPGNRFNVGNPGLGAETIDSLEAGLRHTAETFSLEVSAFAADHDDRIRSVDTGVTTPTGRDVVQSINGGTSRYRGAELQLRWAPAPGTSVDAVLGAVRGEDDFGGEVTPGDRIPPLNGRLRLSQRLTPTLEGSISLSGAAEQDRLSARDVRDPRIDPDGTAEWLRVDAALSWHIRDDARLSLELGNLGDEAYREHGSGLDAPGRYVSVSADWSFGGP